MRVNIQVKQLSRRIRAVVPFARDLPITPSTLRQLISLLVEEEVRTFHRQQKNEIPEVTTHQELGDMSGIGKIAFGIPFTSGQVELQDAVDTAILGFQDGLYRVFIHDIEIERLDDTLHLRENDTITIIRLVMLTGGIF